MTHVLYATNRQSVASPPGARPAFTDIATPPAAGGISYGSADITGIDISQPSSGTITALTAPHPDQFSETDLHPLLSSQNDILVFVHGAANSFEDAITRAAYNKTWLGASNVAGVSSVCDVIAFSWPARAYVLANIIGDFLDYRHDQAQASASAFHFGVFLQQIVSLRKRVGKRRINLLCHSMGNFMLGGAVEHVFANPGAPEVPVFDEIVLAAADEVANTFSVPNGGRMSNLWRLGREITVYFDNDDIAMALSHIANQNFRLGYDGPPNAADTAFFSRNVYEFVNCTGVTDYISPPGDAPDRSHQYYRQSPTVRADIVSTLAGVTPQRLAYDEKLNTFRLFPQPVLIARLPDGPGNAG